jgi:adenylate cyclase
MKYTALILCLGGLLSGPALLAQSIPDLEARLKKASSKNDKLNLSFQLAEKLMPSNPGKAAEYAVQANQIAVEVGDKRREADAAYMSGEGMLRTKNYREAAARFNRAWNTARNYGLRDVTLNTAEKLQDIALRQNDYKEALKWSRETVGYLRESGGNGRSGGESNRRLENQLAAVEADNRTLREQLAAATGQSQVLETSYQSQLKEVQEKNQSQISQQQAALSQITVEKQRADSMVRYKNNLLRDLTAEQMADSMVRAQQERELQTNRAKLALAELAREQSENLRNLLALVATFILALAGLFYVRYRAKRRTADELALKNSLIEEEQKRSESLLLNILPSAIAQELKSKNKVAARKYEKATVMFIDFKGFTNVSERLSPERLVEELDLCFSNFDRIISQYRIEKIKTIGDAYMCASGLSDMNASPSDIIRAALEIQDFLLGLKAERLGQGMPFFEARVGVHIGPVVAGVVGAKKFAYDIWGDTVNVAARMEETCEPGRVNVSETAYWAAKYDFEWQFRGKVAAKNKGDMEMYYVTAHKQK